MADEGELNIEILPDDEPAAETAAPVEKQSAKAEAAPDATAELQSQFEVLKQQSKENERRRIEAEQQAAQSRQEAEQARKAQASSHLDTVTTALASAKQEAEAAKQAIRSAKASGDAEAELEAIDRLSAARAQELRLDEARQDIEARQKAPPKRPAPTDPVEAFVAGRTQRTADWVRAHPTFVTSQEGMRKLNAAHAVAVDEGLIPDTPQYFERVEKYVGLREPNESPALTAHKATPTEASQVSPPQKPRSAAPPVAPGGAVNGGRSNDAPMQIKKREYLSATDGTLVWNHDDKDGKFKKGDPIGVKEFLRRKEAMIKSGQYDRSFTES